MDAEIRSFDYDGIPLRTLVDENGDPWFIADDLFDIIGVENGPKVIARLDPTEQNTVAIPGNPEMTIISESGLCRITLRTWHPQAKGFRHWITHEVFPSIRK